MALQLQFRSDTSSFECLAKCANSEYNISLADFNETAIESATVMATQISNWIEENLVIIKIFVATTLLALKNDVWLDENETPVNEDEFINTIELHGLLGFSEGGFEIYFNDNDLFWGHIIKVDVDEEFNLIGANIGG
jgi:hypothetical protein